MAHSPEVMQMARRVIDEAMIHPGHKYMAEFERAAALAIVQTTELAARLAANSNGYSDVTGDKIATDLRTFSHIPPAPKESA